MSFSEMMTHAELSQKDVTGSVISAPMKFITGMLACNNVEHRVCANHSASDADREVAVSLPMRQANGGPPINKIAHCIGRSPPCEASAKAITSKSSHGSKCMLVACLSERSRSDLSRALPKWSL